MSLQRGSLTASSSKLQAFYRNQLEIQRQVLLVWMDSTSVSQLPHKHLTTLSPKPHNFNCSVYLVISLKTWRFLLKPARNAAMLYSTWMGSSGESLMGSQMIEERIGLWFCDSRSKWVVQLKLRWPLQRLFPWLTSVPYKHEYCTERRYRKCCSV